MWRFHLMAAWRQMPLLGMLCIKTQQGQVHTLGKCNIDAVSTPKAEHSVKKVVDVAW